MRLPRLLRRMLPTRWIGSWRRSVPMADEPIEALAGGVTPPADGRACEFCGCRLTAKGEVIQLSARARELRNHETQLAGIQAELTAARSELSSAQQRIAELEKQLEPPAPEKPVRRFGIS